MSSPASREAEAGHNFNNNNIVNNNNSINNNCGMDRGFEIVSSLGTDAVDVNGVKVIATIPPENSYPKSLYPYTPFRLLPMSRFADVGKFYEWQELKQKVRHFLCLANPFFASAYILFLQCHAAGDEAQQRRLRHGINFHCKADEWI